MKISISLFLVTLLFYAFNQPSSPKLKGLKVFYHDTQTEKGKDIYREFTQIGEDPWAKPDKFDVKMSLGKLNFTSSEKIEVLVETLYEPTTLNKSKNSLRDKRWVPQKVVFTETGASIKLNKLIKENTITLKDVSFNFFGFSSQLYDKLSFRIVAIYFDENTNQFERLEHEIFIPE